MTDTDPTSAAGTPEPAASGGSDFEPPPRSSGYQRLEDAILDERFAEVDLALRRGRHVHKGDASWFEYLSEARELLEPFYLRYGCQLEQRSDGYFFLLPVSDSLGKRHLGVAEMIVGQGLALCYLDPQSVQRGGIVTREELLNQLAAVMGTDALMRTLNPKRKRVDERVMQRTVRQKVNEALRRLSLLGFVELLEGDELSLAPSLMRFAEPVRGLDAPSEALRRLIERGEVSLGPGDPEPDDGEAEDAEGDGELDAPAQAPEGAAAFVDPDDVVSPDDAVSADDVVSSDEGLRAAIAASLEGDGAPLDDARALADSSPFGDDDPFGEDGPFGEAGPFGEDAPHGGGPPDALDPAGGVPGEADADAPPASGAQALGATFADPTEIDFNWDPLPDEPK